MYFPKLYKKAVSASPLPFIGVKNIGILTLQKLDIIFVEFFDIAFKCKIVV